tara:strand:- start:739 stop:1782 length:1044 start_codon:yes stop_codon:yes gene_type:complete
MGTEFSSCVGLGGDNPTATKREDIDPAAASSRPRRRKGLLELHDPGRAEQQTTAQPAGGGSSSVKFGGENHPERSAKAKKEDASDEQGGGSGKRRKSSRREKRTSRREKRRAKKQSAALAAAAAVVPPAQRVAHLQQVFRRYETEKAARRTASARAMASTRSGRDAGGGGVGVHAHWGSVDDRPPSTATPLPLSVQRTNRSMPDRKHILDVFEPRVDPFDQARLWKRVVVRHGDKATRPAWSQTIHIRYRGFLAADYTANATADVFFDHAEEVQFKIGVGQVIRAWDEGVMQMSLGERAVFYVPHAYGYGAFSSGDVRPYSDLVYDVELIQVRQARWSGKPRKMASR